jgi:hypothetical protein
MKKTAWKECDNNREVENNCLEGVPKNYSKNGKKC